MPREETKSHDNFIVVAGKRRWFSIPGRDENLTGLQKRIDQERRLSIPDRPSEMA